MNRLQLPDPIIAKVRTVVRVLGMGLGALALYTSPALSQKKGDRVRVLAGSALRTAPGGQVVGVLSRTFEAPVEMVQGTAVRMRLSGFVNEQDVRLEGNRLKGLVGSPKGNAEAGGTLRTGPSDKEPELASLKRGAVVFSGQKAAAFLAVNRTVWVDKSRLAKFSAPTAPARPAPTPTTSAKPLQQADPVIASAKASLQPAAGSAQSKAAPTLPLMQTIASSALRSGPDGNVVTTLPLGVVVTPLASDNGWTRVRVEGWVATKDLTAATEKALGELSAADLKADPAGTKGRTVRWTVEALSYQLGDGLRRELNGAPYLLARGPGNERSILYLAVPDSLVNAAQGLAPLTTITVTARVRSGKSEPGGVPILDLLELSRR